jgi:leucyl-tRNA synthetase
MRRYNPKEIEPKWQAVWDKSGIYKASESKSKPKKYVLEYFPYPSGAAMHVGHVRNYTIGDVVSRSLRMQGFNVLHPMGWDAFGLPAENYAIANKVSPQRAVSKNVEHFKKQLMQMGFSYDWGREINSTDPDFYKWTQWFFLLLHKRGLAYQKEALVNWDPVEKTVLANEQVIDGRGERSGALVEKKSLKQWFFKITDYSDRLDKDLDKVNWSEAIKHMQRNWIGRSTGAEIDFKLDDSDKKIKVFTTRPDTIFGATFMVLAPEHSMALSITSSEKIHEVKKYIEESEHKTEIDRMVTERTMSGVFTGAYAINPANKEKIPVWVADYVLPGYGTGAIMAVPAHDERDNEFALKFDLPIKQVVQKPKTIEGIYTGEGKLIDSGKFTGIETDEAINRTTAEFGKAKVNYKIHDWLISRQRYWGAPIPIIHCPKDGAVPVPEEDLPVKLPEISNFEPGGDGRGPLAKVPDFVNAKCPKCGGDAKRETDTMDGFACSSWYFLRFADPHNDGAAFSKDKAEFWLPVDDYIGGAEHAVMHLLYARFWTKVMFDEGLISFDEPFNTLRNHGMILAPDGQKMSKSKGNTIEPDGLIEQGYGADSIRLMELFIGPWNQAANWSVEGMAGMYRFLQRLWTLVMEFTEVEKKIEGHNTELEVEVTRAVHKAIKKVTNDINALSFNTALAALMECVNELYKIKSAKNFDIAYGAWLESLENIVQLLAPFAPHITEELWRSLGHEDSVHLSRWPEWEEELIAEDIFTMAVQINGKLRGEVLVTVDAKQQEAESAAKQDDKIADHLKGKKIKKIVFVPNRLINFVV